MIIVYIKRKHKNLASDVKMKKKKMKTTHHKNWMQHKEMKGDKEIVSLEAEVTELHVANLPASCKTQQQ